MLNQLGRVRRLAMVALFAAGWFFRDWAATGFDQQARDAQQVLSEKAEHTQRQQQNSDQRQILSLLKRIELEQRKLSPGVTQSEIDVKEAKLRVKEVKEEGKALSDDANAFLALLPRVEGNGKRAQHEKIAKNAVAIAQKVTSLEEPTGAQSMEQEDALEDKLEDLLDESLNATWDLGDAWDELETAAQKDQEEASSTAQTSRAVAWIGTLISALLAGDWTKALGMLTPGGNAGKEGAGGEGTAV